MLMALAIPVRTLVLAGVLAFAAQTAIAGSTATEQSQTTSARTTARTKSEADSMDRDGVPLGGVLIIVGIVGVVIVLAWVASRIGDNRPTI